MKQSKQAIKQPNKCMQASTEVSKPANKPGSQACLPAYMHASYNNKCVCAQHLMNVDNMLMVKKPCIDVNISEKSGKNIWMSTPLHQNVLIHTSRYLDIHIWKSGCVQIAR